MVRWILSNMCGMGCKLANGLHTHDTQIVCFSFPQISTVLCGWWSNFLMVVQTYLWTQPAVTSLLKIYYNSIQWETVCGDFAWILSTCPACLIQDLLNYNQTLHVFCLVVRWTIEHFGPAQKESTKQLIIVLVPGYRTGRPGRLKRFVFHSEDVESESESVLQKIN